MKRAGRMPRLSSRGLSRASLGTWLRTFAGVLLIALTAGAAYATLLSAASATIQPIALDYGEPIVYSHALRVIDGQPLYQPIDRPPHTVAAYTPLYYLAGAAVGAVAGPGFGPGRMLSLAAGLVSALLIGAVASRRASAAWAAPFAATLFLALAFPGGTPWLGLYRVDLLGVALSLASVAILSYRRSTGASVAAGVFAGLALLSKQSFVAGALAGSIWLWPDWRLTRAFAAAALLTFAVPGVFLQVSTGAFVENALVANLNPFDLSVAAGLLREFGAAQWLPLLLAAAYLVIKRPWQFAEQRLPVIYWAASSLSLAALAKVGANHNYWIEFAAATAILGARGAVCLVGLSRPVVGALMTAGLIVLVGGLLGHGLVETAVGGVGALRSMAFKVQSDVAMLRAGAHDAEFDQLVDRVRDTPGLVLADPLDVVVLARRPVYVEPLIYTILLDAGYLHAQPLVDQICGGQVRLLVLGYSLDQADNMSFGRFDAWPPAVRAALRDAMHLDGAQAGRYVYTPRPRPDPDCGADRS